MKIFSLLFLFVSFQALATNVCEYKDSHEFDEKHEKSIVSKNDGNRLSSFERKMIFEFMKKDSWREIKDGLQAVREFFEGYSGGEIVYYKIENKMIAKLHFYPGDNEYGIFYELSAGNFKELAEIQDGDIYCL